MELQMKVNGKTPAMQKFRDNCLGAFIHWGLYAIPGENGTEKYMAELPNG